MGRNLFHVKYINLSYRIRGYEPRAQTKTEARNIVNVINIKWFIKLIEVLPMKNVALNNLIIKIFAYSAIKIKAKVALLYSVLKPETSSDSPSAKSKGVRFVSAKFVINHKINIGNIRIMIHDVIFIFISLILIEWWNIKHEIKISDIDTSYEIVWAIPRKEPISEYFEFEHHPAIKVEYTFNLDTHKKYNTPNIKIIWGLECG